MNPQLDLLLERVIDVPCEKVWAAWTQPEQLKEWFTPAPWSTAECEIDLRPGGRFRTVMRSPEGELFPGDGCYLEVVENRRLSWTNMLGPDYRPATLPNDGSCESMPMTAIVTFEPQGPNRTKYTALVLHADDATRRRHEEMGFQDGWGAALDQLVALVRRQTADA